jgi:hypothetical protein
MICIGENARATRGSLALRRNCGGQFSRRVGIAIHPLALSATFWSKLPSLMESL